MAKVVAETEIRVVEGAHVVVVGTEPRNIPESLVDACIAAGAKRVDDVVASAPTKRKTTKVEG
ncbi:MAG: hypothetical protein IE913_08230 [Halothiobacillus sp.]|nr:hypothetical protein [Halothiobacillus sp.]